MGRLKPWSHEPKTTASHNPTRHYQKPGRRHVQCEALWVKPQALGIWSLFLEGLACPRLVGAGLAEPHPAPQPHPPNLGSPSHLPAGPHQDLGSPKCR